MHELKIDAHFYNDVFNGIKKFELRKDDRDFRVGDFIKLREINKNGYTGRSTYVTIIYILRNREEFGLLKGYAILGID